MILGAGLAGLSLARQLLLNTDKSIALLEKREQVPPTRQKVGEATVQLSGYYFSKVLDLEEHLLKKHLMKYNLRFYWKTDSANDSYEQYSQTYIRSLSNIATYQLDRNVIEAELLRLNRQSPSFTLYSGTKNLSVEWGKALPHRVLFECGSEEYEVDADWVVDTTGRSSFLTRQLGLARKNPIRHGASFMWVDGLLSIEKLTGQSERERRLSPQRRHTGHLPVWLATNHFVGEGFWFWVIPLQGKTSIGLVYDRKRIRDQEVNSPAKLVEWVCHEFPLFSRQLKKCCITDHGSFKDFSYDCRQTISHEGWAISGEAGRFSDPLYSPGGDLIALHNTLISDCIQTMDAAQLRTKTRLYEVMMRALYQAYVPSYALSYDLLGDQECFSLKYAWELTVYFTLFVFPFINDLYTNLEFLPPYLRELSRLGKLNHQLQQFLVDYYEWKKPLAKRPSTPRFFELMEIGPLRESERMFYSVSLSPEEALEKLSRGVRNLEELVRYIVSHVYASVSQSPSLLTNPAFVNAIVLNDIVFDPARIEREGGRHRTVSGTYRWSFLPWCLADLVSPSVPQDPQSCPPQQADVCAD